MVWVLLEGMSALPEGIHIIWNGNFRSSADTVSPSWVYLQASESPTIVTQLLTCANFCATAVSMPTNLDTWFVKLRFHRLKSVPSVVWGSSSMTHDAAWWPVLKNLMPAPGTMPS